VTGGIALQPVTRFGLSPAQARGLPGVASGTSNAISAIAPSIAFLIAMPSQRCREAHFDLRGAAFRQYALNDHSSPYVLKDLDRMIRAELDWREVGRYEPDQNIVDGMRLLNFGPGHAREMLGLQVSLRSEPGVILVSDACYTADNYGPPAKQPRISYDSVGISRTVQRIKALASDSGYTIWYGHDANQFASVRKATEGHYE